MTLPTLVLIHGAGDTARVWESTQVFLTAPSVAVDVLGRSTRPFDLTQVTIELAAMQVAADVRSATLGPVIVVAHSASGVIGPRVVATLGAQACHLVLVAGVTAPEGEVAADTVHPERREAFLEARPRMLREHAGSSYARGDALAQLPGHLRAIDDPRTVRAIESLNLMFQPVSWAGVSRDLPRTFVRPLGDQLQTPEMQARLITAARCSEIIDIDADHTPARSAPRALATMLDEIASRYASTTAQ